MKKLLTLILLLLTTLTIKADVIVKVAPFTQIKNQYFRLGVERAVKKDPQFSFVVNMAKNIGITDAFWSNTPNGSMMGFFIFGNPLIDMNYRYNFDKCRYGYTIEPEVRMYFTTLDMQKFYWGAFSGASAQTIAYTFNSPFIAEQKTVYEKRYTAALGFQLGYQKYFGRNQNIVIDMYYGLGLKKRFIVGNLNTRTYGMPFLRSNISVGYRIQNKKEKLK